MRFHKQRLSDVLIHRFLMYLFCCIVMQGTLMENFFTKPPEDFERYMRTSENPFVPDGEDGKPKREAYRYALVRLRLFNHFVK